MIRPLVSLAVLLGIVSAAASVSDNQTPVDCANPPLDSCAFYSSCLEAQVHCGPNGYPIGYGQKYCQKFQAERASLSPNGQKWMVDTMHCLQVSLVEDATAAVEDQEETCSALSKKAFGTHAKCYLANGLCRLKPDDWVAIVDIVDFKTLFESWAAFKASVQAAFGCAGFYVFMLRKWWLS